MPAHLLLSAGLMYSALLEDSVHGGEWRSVVLGTAVLAL